MTGLPPFILSNVEAVANKVLALDPDARRNLSLLDGKVIAIELTDLQYTIFLFPAERTVSIRDKFEGEEDTRLKATIGALLNMGIRANTEDSLFSGEVVLSGDMEVGQQFEDFLSFIHIDWEEQLSQLTGDIIAHQIGKLFHAGSNWGKQTIEILGRDTAEYFQYENRSLPAQVEIEEFLSEVDSLRSDLDRLSARIRRIETNITPGYVGDSRAHKEETP